MQKHSLYLSLINEILPYNTILSNVVNKNGQRIKIQKIKKAVIYSIELI